MRNQLLPYVVPVHAPGLYFFTPLFRTIVKNATRQQLTFFVGAAFVISAIDALHAARYGGGSRPFPTWFLSFVPYYFCGYLVATSCAQPRKRHLAGALAACYGLTVLGYFYFGFMQEFGIAEFFHMNLGVTVIAMAIGLMFLLRNWQRPFLGAKATKELAALTFGIYLVHPAVLNIASTFTGIGVRSFNPILSVPTIAVIAFGISASVVWLISRVPYVRRII